MAGESESALSHAHVATADREARLLSWFAAQGLPLFARKRSMGEINYHHLSTDFRAADGRMCPAHGQSQDRKIAAIKCVAEYIERKFTIDHYVTRPDLAPETGLRTSNGWAVHFDRNEAIRRARFEAIERHLLIKSYLKWGWRGLRLIETQHGEEMSVYFLVSSYSCEGLASGMVVTKSPHYPGISLGYCVGAQSEVRTASFWESAVFESVGKIKALNGKALKEDPNCWITNELKHILEEPFDESLLTLNPFDGKFVAEISNESESPTQVFDLSSELGLEMYAAWHRSETLIPIYNKARLSAKGNEQLLRTLALNDLPLEIPERHPIL